MIDDGGTNILDMKQKIAGVDLSTQARVQQALATVTAAIDQLSGQRAGNGTLQNRLAPTEHDTCKLVCLGVGLVYLCL